MMTFLSDISETFSTLQGPIDLKQLLTDSWHPAKRVHASVSLFHHKDCSKCLETLARVKWAKFEKSLRLSTFSITKMKCLEYAVLF